MPVIGLNFIKPKKGGAAGAGILADQLQILENDLGRDGFYSPGDYDILISKARDLQNNPSLSNDQRSGYLVKISGYQTKKAVAGYDSTEGLDKINRNIKSEQAEDVMAVGNNPQEFLKGRISSLQAKLGDLTDIIERRNAAGMDTTEYSNEYTQTLREYSNKLEALGAGSQYTPGAPIQGYAAYVTTNNRGEIVDVDYDKYETRPGYVETNGMIDGYNVFAKPNYKKDGNNHFILGGNDFSGVDMVMPDPANPGAFKTTKLIANPQNKGGMSIGDAGYINVPGGELKVQSYIPSNSYAKGVNGSIYKRNDDGTYTKYLNADEKMLGIPEGGIVRIPQAMERSLAPNIKETIDSSKPILPDDGSMFGAPEGFDFNANPYQQEESSLPMSTMQNITPSAENFTQPVRDTSQMRRTPQQPSTQAPAATDFMSVAKRTGESAVNYVKGLFQ